MIEQPQAGRLVVEGRTPPVEEARRLRKDDVAAALAGMSSSGGALYDSAYRLPASVEDALAAITARISLASDENGEDIHLYGSAFAVIEACANFACLRVEELIVAFS